MGSNYFATKLSRPWLSLLLLSFFSCLLSSVVYHKTRKPPVLPRPALTVLDAVTAAASAIFVLSALLASNLDPVPSVVTVTRGEMLAVWPPVLRGRRQTPATSVLRTASKENFNIQENIMYQIKSN